MAILPIDLQSNMGHVHDVAKMQQDKTDSLVAETQALNKEAAEKAKLASEKLDEAKKSDKAELRPEEEKAFPHKKGGKRQFLHKKEEKAPTKVETVEDDRLGRIIDIKK